MPTLRIRFNWGNSADITDSKKRSSDLPIDAHYFKKESDRTLGYSTLALLDNIIVVTRGNKQDHEEKVFDVLKKLGKAGCQAQRKNVNSS